MGFKEFSRAVEKQFTWMVRSGRPVFEVEVDKDELWNLYLQSFPEGTNPLYRKRSVHDCNCCKNFIRDLGGVIIITEGYRVSIWDLTEFVDLEYRAVAQALSKLVKSRPIRNSYLHPTSNVGKAQTFSEEGGVILTYNHFWAQLPDYLVKHPVALPSELGSRKTAHDTLYRALGELTPDAIQTTIELIEQGSLYRGEPELERLKFFQELLTEARGVDSSKKYYDWVWVKSQEVHGSISGIRNSAIGTLLVDLSNGMGLEDAVRSYEAKVAPTNYRRSKALATPAMMKRAKETIEELGLTPSLHRRYARESDMDSSNFLFVDRSKPPTQMDIFDQLAAQMAKVDLSRVEEVPIGKFLEMLPNIREVELLFESRLSGHLVSLIGPEYSSAPNLFTWGNPFSWSYRGEVTDSIRERVKSAGGEVSGDFLCRLAWNNFDDLDLSVKEPNRNVIDFRKRMSLMGGQLDVDMNAGSGNTRTPVENIFYRDHRTMVNGTYEVYVHNFQMRESMDTGFTVEIEVMGVTYSLQGPPVGDNQKIHVATVEYQNGTFSVKPHLEGSYAGQELWGLTTGQFHPVSFIMKSPNHWGDQRKGLGHYFFMLKGCVNDEGARGFYNEFLDPRLNEHRKALEMVGSKLKPSDDPYQLSGVGFSASSNHVHLRLKGSFNRIVKVVF